MDSINYNKPRTYDKPHRFFEKFIDNDLNRLSTYLQRQYANIERGKTPGITPQKEEAWASSGSISTMKWKEYNVFQFMNEEIYNVFAAVRSLTVEACDYYEIDFKSQKYMVQGWFNINYKHVGKLDWHDHGGPWAPNFHGYYSIKSEPSITYYKINNDENKIKENININNRLILSEMGHPHAMGDWDWDGPRITLAYDVAPLDYLIKIKVADQHWVPLA